MVVLDDVEMDFDLSNLFRKGSISLEFILLDKMRVNLMKYEESDLFNFQIFLMALKSDDKVVRSNPLLHIGSMVFNDLQITMEDYSLNDPMLVPSPVNLNISHMKLVDIMASADSIEVSFRFFKS